MKNETLLDAVQDISGAAFLGLDMSTMVKLKGGKKNPMQGRVFKHVTGATVIAYGNSEYNGYISMIRNRLIKEGKNPDDYKPGERAWGTRVPNMPIIEHTKDGETTYYLEAIFMKPGVTTYTFDGQPIDKKDIEGLDEPAEPSVTPTPSQGGLDVENKVHIRSIKAGSITEIRVNQTVYK